MYFVTLGGQTGYVLFTTTPRGRAAVGVTDTGRVRILAPRDTEWTVLREWPAESFSHTDLMIAAARCSEPENAEELLALLPAESLG